MIGHACCRPAPDRPCGAGARRPAASASSDCGAGPSAGWTITSTIAGIGDGEHAEAEAAQRLRVAGVAFAALAAGRQFGGEPYLVAGRSAIHCLQDQFEVEGELEFPDHHDRRIAAAERHQIAAADLALDREAELSRKL